MIITTNFDQLLEAALRDEGVLPTVIASADAARGAVPLVHSPCTVIKIHGDYMDTRIRNTPAELAQYEPTLDQLLDRVFDEFGLIVCGWSADWDVALKSALERTPSRRYSMYWAARGTPSAAARTLIDHRAMSQIAIDGADSFFADLQAKVAALDEFNAPHPMSTEIAVTLLKKYLAEDRHRIALDDLVRGETKRVIQALDEMGDGVDGRGVYDFESRAHKYELLSTTLVTLGMVAGQWSRADQINPWIDSVLSIARRTEKRFGNTNLVDLMRWPAGLLLHAYGVGALAQGRDAELGPLLTCPVVDSLQKPRLMRELLNADDIFLDGQRAGRDWAKYRTSQHAVTDRLYEVLRPIGIRVLGDATRFERAFVGVELVCAFGVADRRHESATPGVIASHVSLPVGRYIGLDKIRGELLKRWEADPSMLRSAAGLKAEPRFADVEAFVSERRALYRS